MPYTWKYYLLVAHLVDEQGRTVCNRMMAHFDDATGEIPEAHKCKTCANMASGLNFIVKEGSTKQ